MLYSNIKHCKSNTVNEKNEKKRLIEKEEKNKIMSVVQMMLQTD